tara:strand:+ start:1106 stop:1636 length:531 start_codon:yes stop_codon:yes gene_type:complete
MSTYKFKTTNIKGKDYVEVNERIKFFRQETQYNGWAIKTEFPMLTEDEALCRCTISNADGVVIAAGHAHERRDMGMINKTSYVENCETSAVGRALAILGIGIDSSIASANEVETAIAQQKSTPKKEGKEEGDLFSQSITFLKATKKPERVKAFDTIVKKYGDSFSEGQVTALKKFV